MATHDSSAFSVKARLLSFRHAFAGFWFLLRTQHNARLHAVATVGVAVGGVMAGLSAGEWCWIVAAIGGVWMAEAFNTAIESLCDVVTLEKHVGIKAAKDVAAAGVLISAIAAAVIGGIVFTPHVWQLIHR